MTLPSARIDELLAEICGDELNGGLIRDLCYTVWSNCHHPTHEDGNSDWVNDNLPTVQVGVAKVRATITALIAEVKAARERDDRWREMVQAHGAAERMVSDAIEELFGPVASLESWEATLLRGPEPHHRAEGIIEALQRIATALSASPPVKAQAEREGEDAEPVAWLDVLTKQLIGMTVAGCTCNTKSPTLEFHDTRCMYRLASEALDTVTEIREALASPLPVEAGTVKKP